MKYKIDKNVLDLNCVFLFRFLIVFWSLCSCWYRHVRECILPADRRNEISSFGCCNVEEGTATHNNAISKEKKIKRKKKTERVRERKSGNKFTLLRIYQRNQTEKQHLYNFIIRKLMSKEANGRHKIKTKLHRYSYAYTYTTAQTIHRYVYEKFILIMLLQRISDAMTGEKKWLKK